MSLSLTQQWLRQQLGPYAQQERVYSDINDVLSAFPTLRPKTDVYTFDDGRQQLLLCIHGLLPISFRQQTYNIPIASWITHAYPTEPPVTYVVPTGDMLVKASVNVDISGRCQLEYIQGWERKSEGCTLKSLLESMQDVFSRDPPVYAKPKASATSSTPTLPVQGIREPPPSVREIASGPPPVPSIPAALQSPLITPSMTADGRPMPPPRPSGASIFPGLGAASVTPATSPFSIVPSRPAPPLPSSSSNAPSPLGPPRGDRPPPPPWAAAFQAGPSRQASSPSNFVSPPPLPLAVSSSRFSHYGNTPDSYQQGMISAVSTGSSQTSAPYKSAGQGTPAQYTTWAGRSPSMYSPPPAGLAPVAPPLSPPPPPPPQVQPVMTAAPAPKAPAPNFMDSDDDVSATSAQGPAVAVVPPRSANPELLRLHDNVHRRILEELQKFSATVNEDAERLRRMQGDLLHGEPAIRDEMARLVAVRDVFRSVGDRLRGVVGAAEINVADLKKKGDPEVDELVCSTTIVYNQLVNLVAEDNAIEDTIYHLQRALNSGRIDLERFIRTTRVLAEEQFMKRALIHKITSGIPMGAAMTWTP